MFADYKVSAVYVSNIYIAKVDILIDVTNVSIAKVCLIECKGVLKYLGVLFFKKNKASYFLQFVTFLLTDVKKSKHLYADWIIYSTFVVKKVCNILIDRLERLQQHSFCGCVFLRCIV